MSCIIDDVQYLQQVGAQESYLFLVDSAQRDTAAFPKANQYEATFNEPFHNCFSISLIGAKVPRTQYLVDTNNNVLTYKVGNPGVWESAVLTPGDYTIKDLIPALNSLLNGITTTLIPLQNRLTFTSADQFAFDMTQSSMRRVLGFSEPIDLSNTGYTTLATYQPGPTTNPLCHDVFCSVTAAATVVNLVNGPRPVQLQGFSAASTRLLFNATGSGTVASLQLLVTATAATVLPVQLTLQGAIVASGAFNVPVSTTPIYVNANLSCTLSQGVSYMLSFPYPQATVTVYADDVVSPNSNGTYDTTLQLYQGGWQATNDAALCLIFALQSVQTTTTQTLLAPGVYDLTGVRYVSIGCKELTTHLFRSRAYDNWCAGLGTVDLQVYGFQNQSFDFSSYPPREFAPFTLRKLTLTFTCEGSNDLYDFKGVDHKLTFVVRYYTTSSNNIPLTNLNRIYEPDPSRAWLNDFEQEQDMLQQRLSDRRV